MATTDGILEYARWIEEIAPGFIATVIMAERDEDYRDRDLLDQVACLIEIFGLAGAAQIVGCPNRPWIDEDQLDFADVGETTIHVGKKGPLNEEAQVLTQ